jgi:protein gp37
LKWNAEAARSGERKRVFCASLADVFEDRPELLPWRKDLFDLIVATPRLDWLLLTKRPHNIPAMLKAAKHYGESFPSNAWLGTTVESDDQLSRVDDLIEAGVEFAPVLFLSCEPLLGPLNLYTNQRYQIEHGGYRPLIDDIQWVIAGGESGGHARPMILARRESARKQQAGCSTVEHGMSFLFSRLRTSNFCVPFKGWE